VLVVRSRDRVTSLRPVMERARELPFDLRYIGPSFALVPDEPRQVGRWMMVPVRRQEAVDQLPKRAKARMRALLDVGVKPSDVVVYHEIKGPSLVDTHISPKVKDVTSRVAVWTSQDLPVLVEKATQLSREHGPTILRAAGAVVMVSLMIVGTVMLTAVSALASDPVLCILVESDCHDGSYCMVEVDRWFS
jgi:hypothetical protein